MVRRLPAPERYLAVFYGLLILLGLYLTSLYSYLLFHSLVELFIVVVACGIFLIAWNARRFLDNQYVLFIGISYLFVALLELLHTLSYKGMGAFPGFGSNLPTQLWVATRYVESLSLLFAPLLLGKKLKAETVIAAYTVVTGLLLASIFAWDIFPDSYVEGVGLTAFKRASEYIVSLILLASALLLLQKRRFFDKAVLRMLVASIVLNILSELAFTLYAQVYDQFNMAGHFLKLLSFYLIYKAVIETSLVKPYDLLFRDLKRSEGDLRQRTVDLQARNQDLDAFAHTVAHDLKNPLGLVIGYADALAEDMDDLSAAEKQSYLRSIARSGHKMNEIVDGLLLLSEVRKIDVEAERLDMAELVAGARARLVHIIEAYQAEIVAPSSWPSALGYGPWVEEIWANYLSNAIAYGGRPPRVEMGVDVEPNGLARFWVRDNGRGIPPAEQPALFKPFTELSRRHRQGHGLGLSIVESIVTKLGGQVGVESAGVPGQGSVFSFTLPLADGRGGA
jgi:signal transduction histidine kinase